MKKLAKLLAIAAAISTLAFTCTSCSDDSDDGDKCLLDLRKSISGTKVATFAGSGYDEEDDANYENTVYFYKDSEGNTLVQIDYKTQKGSEYGVYTAESGTYTGDPAADGDITIHITKIYYPDDSLSTLEEEDVSYPAYTVTIDNGKFEYDDITYTRK